MPPTITPADIRRHADRCTLKAIGFIDANSHDGAMSEHYSTQVGNWFRAAAEGYDAANQLDVKTGPQAP